MEDCVKRIVDLCAAKGVTRADLCRATDIPPTTLSNYIIRGGKPTYEMLKKITDLSDQVKLVRPLSVNVFGAPYVLVDSMPIAGK